MVRAWMTVEFSVVVVFFFFFFAFYTANERLSMTNDSQYSGGKRKRDRERERERGSVIEKVSFSLA